MTDRRRWSGRRWWVVGLLCVLGVVLTLSLRERSDRLERGRNGQEEGRVANGGDWVFRGGGGLTGVSEMRLGGEIRRRWTFQAEGGVVGSAAIDGDSVYFGCDAGKVYAVALLTGKLRWDFTAEDSVEAPPVFHEGRVLVGCRDGYFYALSGDDGGLQWRFETGGKIVGAATVVVLPGQDGACAAVGSYDQHLYLLAVETGQELGRAEADNYINGAAALSDVGLVFGSCDGLLRVVGLDGGVRGQVDCGDYLAGSAAVWGGKAYVGTASGELLCVDLAEVENQEDGGEGENSAIVWRFADKEGGIFSCPAVTEEVVLFGSRDQRVYCLERETGELRWEFWAGDGVDSAPVVAGDTVVVGSDDGRLYGLRLADGGEVFRHDLGAPIKGEPALGRGVVVVCGEDGVVYCFE